MVAMLGTPPAVFVALCRRASTESLVMCARPLPQKVLVSLFFDSVNADLRVKDAALESEVTMLRDW